MVQIRAMSEKNGIEKFYHKPAMCNAARANETKIK